MYRSLSKYSCFTCLEAYSIFMTNQNSTHTYLQHAEENPLAVLTVIREPPQCVHGIHPVLVVQVLIPLDQIGLAHPLSHIVRGERGAGAGQGLVRQG